MRTLFIFLLIANLLNMPGKISAQQAGNVFTYKLGSVEISLLSESQGNGNKSVLIDARPEMFQKYAPEGTYPMGTNVVFIKTADKNILVDAGYGKNLFTNLQAIGVTPEQIDVVLLTHMHGDHIGGMLRDGQPSFPNASVYLAQPEYDYWMNDSHGEQARNVIAAYKSKLILFQPAELGKKDSLLIPGIHGIAAYGHTPGHTAYLVESGNLRLLVWGDLAHAMAIQMPYPQVAVTYDVNAIDAVSIRKEVLEYVARHKIPVAGMHIAFPGIGTVAKDPASGGYSFTPAQ